MKNVFLPIVIAFVALPQCLLGAAPRGSFPSLERTSHQQYVSSEESVDEGPATWSQQMVPALELQDADWEILVQDVRNASCVGAQDGIAEVVISGVPGEFRVEWNTEPPQFGTKARGLNPGSYTVTVVDQWGNVKQKNVTIQADRTIEAFVRVDSDATHPHARDGAATVVLSRPGIGPHTFEWHTDNSQRTATATGLGKGMHIVTITDSEGCEVTESVTIVNRSNATYPSQLEENPRNPLVTPFTQRPTYSTSPQGAVAPANLIKVFPNPSQGMIQLETQFVETIHVRVLDLQGRQLLASQNLPAARNDLDLSKLPSGVYVLQVLHPLSGQQVTERLTLR